MASALCRLGPIARSSSKLGCPRFGVPQRALLPHSRRPTHFRTFRQMGTPQFLGGEPGILWGQEIRPASQKLRQQHSSHRFAGKTSFKQGRLAQSALSRQWSTEMLQVRKGPAAAAIRRAAQRHALESPQRVTSAWTSLESSQLRYEVHSGGGWGRPGCSALANATHSSGAAIAMDDVRVIKRPGRRGRTSQAPASQPISRRALSAPWSHTAPGGRKLAVAVSWVYDRVCLTPGTRMVAVCLRAIPSPRR